MNLMQLFYKITGRGNTLKESRQIVNDLKDASNAMTDKAVKESINRSRQAGNKFDKMSIEMRNIADDVAVKIARSAGR